LCFCECTLTLTLLPKITVWLQFGGLIADLKKNVEGAEDVIFSTHCQNDLGLASANSLAGAMNGARQVECTINGIGERAGNAALEEVVMSLALKGKEQFGDPLYTAINPIHITATSKMVTEYTGMACQPHKAIVGVNAFQHESGIHQDGMIKNKATYEIMTPESIGLNRGDSQSGAGIVLGKHSGRNAVNTRLKELGYEFDVDKLNKVFARFKEVAEKKKGGLEDEDLEALVSDQSQTEVSWTIQDLQVNTGMSGIPTATVTMLGPDGISRYVAATGTGPIDAVYKSIDMLVGIKVDLETYDLKAVNEGIDALAVTRVSIAPCVSNIGVSSTSIHSQTGNTVMRKFSGTGSDGDIVVASARAYVSALNKLIAWNKNKVGGVEGGGERKGTKDAVPLIQ